MRQVRARTALMQIAAYLTLVCCTGCSSPAPPPPLDPGWQQVSWNCSFGDVYRFQIPKDWQFFEKPKTGKCWIGPEDDDDLITCGSAWSTGFAEYTKDDTLTIAPEKVVLIGGMKFRRIDFSGDRTDDREHDANLEKGHPEANEHLQKHHMKGIWLVNDRIGILVHLERSPQYDIAEKILATLRK